jgi:transposase
LSELAAIYEGSSRGEAADLVAVTRQIARDWVERFNAEGPNGLIARKQPGTTRRLNDEYRAALAKAVDEGPAPWGDGVVRWRLIDLEAWMYETFGVSSSEDILGRELRDLSYRLKVRSATWQRCRVGTIRNFVHGGAGYHLGGCLNEALNERDGELGFG